MVRVLPPGASRDAGLLLETRGIRAFGDGLISVVLAAYLGAVGLSDVRIGIVVTLTLLGSAALTLAVGLRAHAYPRRRLLQFVSLLMVATGLGFAAFSSFWPLALVGLIGTLNPSGGDVSVFLPTEQALLPSTAPDVQRTALFARYTLIGALVAAVGALCAGVPEAIGEWLRRLAGDVAAVGLRRLRRARRGRARPLPPALAGRRAGRRPAARARSGESRRTVYRLAALFSLDAFGGGFVITALLVLWLQRRFGLSIAVTGAVFFWAGVLSAFSALVAVRIARRIGLVRTMVFTHLPANGLLILAAFMPTAPLAVGCLLARAALSQMDVPVRTSYVMAVVVARRATGRGERHQRAAQPGRGAAGDRRRLDARAVDVRLAADHRRRHQGDLRPVAAGASSATSARPRRWREPSPSRPGDRVVGALPVAAATLRTLC